MVGNARDAEFIHEWVRSHMNDWSRPSDEAKENPPEGWEYLGSGSFRSVWRSPDGVAYKVQHRPTSGQSNESEWVSVQQAYTKPAPAGTRLPLCSFYERGNRMDGVMAMECIAGSTLDEFYGGDFYHIPDVARDLMWNLETTYGLGDMHEQNVMVEDETELLIPIDFGY